VSVVFIMRWLSAEMFRIGDTNIKSVFILSEVPSKHDVMYAHVEVDKKISKSCIGLAIDYLENTEFIKSYD